MAQAAKGAQVLKTLTTQPDIGKMMDVLYRVLTALFAPPAGTLPNLLRNTLPSVGLEVKNIIRTWAENHQNTPLRAQKEREGGPEC